MKRVLGWLSILTIAVLVACVPSTEEDMTDDMTGMEGDFTLQLLHFADVDGGRDIIRNAPRFAALLDAFRSEMPDATVVLSSGDNWIPGPEYNVAEDDALADVLSVPGAGRAHIAWLNALGVQASAFGNHEFDVGTGAVADLIAPSTDEDTGATWEGASFPYLSANLDFSTDEALAPLVGTDGAQASSLAGQVAGYTTIGVGGETVGVVGATTPSLASISSPGDITITPADRSDRAALAAEIQTAVDALSAEGINKIILLAHMQSISIESELAPLLSDVDIIVAGGSNTVLADAGDRLLEGDTAAGTYPLEFEGAGGDPVLLVNVDGDYSYLGRLVVDFDENGVLLPDRIDAGVSGAYATDEQALGENGLSEADTIPEVQAVSDALGSALEARAGNIVGTTSVFLNGERGDVRSQETNLGNLSADANLAYAQSVEPATAVSIKNGGGIRGAIGACILPPGSNDETDRVCNPPAGVPGINAPGEVSQLDLEIAFRFNNGLSLLTVTGEQLVELMEHGVAAVADVAGQFPQVAGLTFSYDPNAEPGSRLMSLSVNDANGAEEGGESVSVLEDGTLTDAADQTFRIVTLGFLAEGGDDYPFPSDEAANLVNLVQEGTQTGSFTFADDGTEQDALAEYFGANYPDDAGAFMQEDTPPAQDTRIVNLAAE